MSACTDVGLWRELVAAGCFASSFILAYWGGRWTERKKLTGSDWP